MLLVFSLVCSGDVEIQHLNNLLQIRFSSINSLQTEEISQPIYQAKLDKTLHKHCGSIQE